MEILTPISPELDHHLRNRLTALMGLSKEILETPQEPLIFQTLSLVESECAHWLTLLNYSHLFQTSHSQLSSQELLTLWYQTYLPLFEKKGCKVSFQFAKSSVSFKGSAPIFFKLLHELSYFYFQFSKHLTLIENSSAPEYAFTLQTTAPSISPELPESLLDTLKTFRAEIEKISGGCRIKLI